MNIYTSLFGINFALKNYNKFTTKKRWIYDKQALLEQANKWAIQLPWIKPYYAIKSNPLPYILKDLTHYKVSNNKFNIGLDVSSIKETTNALKYTTLENTIYTNPHIIPHEINKYLFNIKVIDSICELELLNKNNIA